MADLVTLDTAKTFLRITGTADDTTLSQIIGWASERITQELTAAAPESFTQTVSADVGRFVLSHTPVVSLTSITAITSWSPTVNVDDLQVTNALAGLVEAISGSTPCGLYTVAYTAGRDALPTAVEGACLALVRHWWNQSQAHASATYGDAGFVPDFRDLPNTVRTMLGAVPKPPGVA